MKIINENIYAGNTNNKINKKKYKKHSQSPFTTLDAGNVEKNVEFFNHMNSMEANINSSAGMNGNTVSESLLEDTNINSIIDDILDTLKSGLDWLEDK